MYIYTNSIAYCLFRCSCLNSEYLSSETSCVVTATLGGSSSYVLLLLLLLLRVLLLLLLFDDDSNVNGGITVSFPNTIFDSIIQLSLIIHRLPILTLSPIHTTIYLL